MVTELVNTAVEHARGDIEVSITIRRYVLRLEVSDHTAALPDPPYLTTTDRAAAETEVAALRATPCASDYFAAAALDWQKQHPSDPRTPDILGFAERVVRNGCRTDATKELNHRLFVVVQTKYPKSEWARRYKTWE